MTSQASFAFEHAAIPEHHYRVGKRSSGQSHGVVMTKPHVVELILDLVGYKNKLHDLRFLEPACGEGAFLLPAIKRLLRALPQKIKNSEHISKTFRAYDIDLSHVRSTRQRVAQVLTEHGFSFAKSLQIAANWVRHEDFLLATHTHKYDIVVGNPPYVRIEQLSPLLQKTYRRLFSTIYDRADLYVAFIECGLRLLSPAGKLGFICADRWILNKYGAPLRELVTREFFTHAYIDLHTATPFESDVIAYPSIFVLGKNRAQKTHVAKLKRADEKECHSLQRELNQPYPRKQAVLLKGYSEWFAGDTPWTISAPEQLAALRKLEKNFKTIEQFDGTRVGIGVATGKDKVFIVDPGTSIEPSRLVPLIKREDLKSGRIQAQKRFVINVFGADGHVVNLDNYPGLASYLARHEGAIRGRHVAKKNPRAWFRTIDRVYPELVPVAKLLIPDIAGANQVVLDEGHFYPHHNLYFVTSDLWDMNVLGGLLSSKIALFFVWSYGVKMRGGYLRFQAQYLRRIRLPDPRDISPVLQGAIASAFRQRDFVALDRLAAQAYGLRHLPEFEFVDTRA